MASGSDSGMDFIKIAVGIIVTLLLIGFVFLVVKFGQNTGNKSLSNLSSSASNIDEAKFTQYDGETVDGSVVESVVTQYANEKEVGIGVCTSSDTAGKWYGTGCTSNPSSVVSGTGELGTTTTSDTSATTTAGGADEVTPTAEFKAKVVRNSNKKIVGIVFTQQ